MESLLSAWFWIPLLGLSDGGRILLALAVVVIAGGLIAWSVARMLHLNPATRAPKRTARRRRSRDLLSVYLRPTTLGDSTGEAATTARLRTLFTTPRAKIVLKAHWPRHAPNEALAERVSVLTRFARDHELDAIALQAGRSSERLDPVFTVHNFDWQTFPGLLTEDLLLDGWVRGMERHALNRRRLPVVALLGPTGKVLDTQVGLAWSTKRVTEDWATREWDDPLYVSVAGHPILPGTTLADLVRLRETLGTGPSTPRIAFARVDGTPASHNLLAEADTRLPSRPGTTPPALLVFTEDPVPTWLDHYPGWTVLPLGAIQWLSLWIGRQAGHDLVIAPTPSLFLHGDWPASPVGRPL